MEWLDHNKIPLNQKKDIITFENRNLFNIHTQIYIYCSRDLHPLSLIKELFEKSLSMLNNLIIFFTHFSLAGGINIVSIWEIFFVASQPLTAILLSCQTWTKYVHSSIHREEKYITVTQTCTHIHMYRKSIQYI